jgi:hypothetical protein
MPIARQGAADRAQRLGQRVDVEDFAGPLDAFEAAPLQRLAALGAVGWWSLVDQHAGGEVRQTQFGGDGAPMPARQ